MNMELPFFTSKVLFNRKMLIALTICFTYFFGTTFSQGAGRVALVYGNAAYENAPSLANPANDAALIRESLEKVGFKVVTVIDGTQDQMRKSLSKFGRLAENADIALFYYAGHGLQVAGRNWLLPVDADIVSSTDLPASAINANTVLELMELSGAKARIAILDACRNNPLSRSLSRSSSRGLAKIDSSAAGTMIIFATQPGNVALDGTGKNSPFSKALAKQILTPGVEIRQMIGRVRRDVMADTNDKQVPWVNEAIVGDIYLASAPQLTPAPTTLITPPPTNNSNNTALEIAFWESVKNSSDQNMLQLYVNRFPQGVFVEIAKARITGLQKPAPAPVQKPTPTQLPQQTSRPEANQQTARLENNTRGLEVQRMKENARSFMEEFHSMNSFPSEEYLDEIDDFYSKRVNFYGKNINFRAIIRDKTNFVSRWPQRYYAFENNNMNISCFPNAQFCSIEGVLNWEVKSNTRNKSASGRSSAYYEVEFTDDGLRITVEDGQVLRRD